MGIVLREMGGRREWICIFHLLFYPFLEMDGRRGENLDINRGGRALCDLGLLGLWF